MSISAAPNCAVAADSALVLLPRRCRDGVGRRAAGRLRAAFPTPRASCRSAASITEIVYALGEEKQAGRPRLDQPLSRSGAEAAGCRLYARAVAGRRAVGQSDRHPRRRGQRPAGGDRRADEGQRSLRSTVPESLRPRGHPRRRSTSSARLLGVDDKADGAGRAGRRRSRRRRSADRPSAWRERKRVLFILSLQGGKILASGTGTAANGIITLAGAVNAVERLPGYKPLTDEAIIDRQARRHPDDGPRRRTTAPTTTTCSRIRPSPLTPAGQSTRRSSAWTAAICSASARARPAPSAI